MLFVVKLLRDNNISLTAFSKMLSSRHFLKKFAKERDFTIDELNIIKDKLIDLHLIDVDFDIGDLLNEV